MKNRESARLRTQMKATRVELDLWKVLDAFAKLLPRVVRTGDKELIDDFGAILRVVRNAAESQQRDRARVERIRKDPTITADDLRDAELRHARRAAQAKHLGISERHLRRLRSELL